MKNLQRIIKQIALENDLSYEVLSCDLIIKLTKGNKIRYINGYKFGLNSHSLGLILDDKYATYELLNSLGISVCKHHILFRPTNHNSYAKNYNSFDYCYDLFLKYNKNVILKVNNGTCGDGVYHITTKKELKKIYNHLLKYNFSISLCPYYDIKNEYRVILLNNEIKIMYGKINPVVIGNGKDKLIDLLKDFNINYFGYKTNLKKNINYNKVLKKDEKFIYDFKYNLSKGSIITEDIDKETKSIISKMAKDVSKKINLGFGSIDIIKTNDDKYYVLEINSGVMIENYIKLTSDGFKKAKKVYEEAVLEMFK
ncbi:MAG: hypothetical protein MR297_03580 [Tenericutes bacterium]|nr:hypothetical protein [Mycoplasmatota bacterium]